MILSPGSQLGPYKILSPLGAGGMGEVYRARDARLERDVAIKVLPERLAEDPDALARFQKETKALAALSHTNILPIYDIGSERGITYAVTELLEGETLRQRMAHGRITWRKALEFTIAIVDGLSAAHSKGIIHRDLKPENIFLTSDDHLKILDFGLARRDMPSAVKDVSSAQTELPTETGIVMGTVPYMSPEQARGEKVDARSDIFSLGCILYEMLSGRRPFAGNTNAEILAAILKDDFNINCIDSSFFRHELSELYMKAVSSSTTLRAQPMISFVSLVQKSYERAVLPERGFPAADFLSTADGTSAPQEELHIPSTTENC